MHIEPTNTTSGRLSPASISVLRSPRHKRNSFARHSTTAVSSHSLGNSWTTKTRYALVWSGEPPIRIP